MKVFRLTGKRLTAALSQFIALRILLKIIFSGITSRRTSRRISRRSSTRSLTRRGIALLGETLARMSLTRRNTLSTSTLAR